MHARTTLRVLKPLASAVVANEQELYEFVRGIQWHGPLTLKTTFAIDCDTFHQEMNHNIFLAQKSKDAIVDQFREKYDLRPSVSPKDPDVLINLHVGRDGDRNGFAGCLRKVIESTWLPRGYRTRSSE